MLQLGLSALYSNNSTLDAMAHSSRPHPYRATSTVETPLGTRNVGWLAGPRGLPGHVNPPPKPTCSYFDWLLSLTGNWLIAANLTVNTTWLWLVQISKMLVATNLKLCSPGSRQMETSWSRPPSHWRTTFLYFKKIEDPMGHPTWPFEFGVSLLRPGRWYIPSPQWYDDPAAFGGIPTRMATPTVQLHRILFAHPGYLTAFRATSAMPQKWAPVWSCPDTLTSQKRPCPTVLFVAPMTFY